MKRILACLLFVLMACPVLCTGSANQIIQVDLHSERLDLGSKLEGMTNIFFEPFKEGADRLPENWKDIRIADILENDALAPIRAVRYRLGDETHYRVDSDGDLDFLDEQVLRFHPLRDLTVAEAVVQVRPLTDGDQAQTHSRSQGSEGSVGQEAFEIPYQIILSKEYAYARIAEGRRGRMILDGSSYDVFLRPRSRNHPLYALSQETVCLIDFNQDATFSSAWEISPAGGVLRAENIDLTAPFLLGKQRMQAVSLDRHGTRLILQPSSQEQAVSIGFQAPPFRLHSLAGDSFESAKLNGKIVLLEFWSVHCPWCARSRPQVNELIARNRGADFVALAVARETDGEEVGSYLAQYPLQAEVALYHESLWRTYNPETVTPLYCLIDPHGTVALLAAGAKSELMKVIDKLIEDIRKGT